MLRETLGFIIRSSKCFGTGRESVSSHIYFPLSLLCSALQKMYATALTQVFPKLRIKAKEKGAEPPLKVSVLTTFVGHTPRRGDAIGAAVCDQLAHVLTGVRDSDQRR